MKRLLYLVFLAILSSAPVYAHGGSHFSGGSHFAGGHGGYGHGGYGYGWRRGGGWYWGGGWIEPVVIGDDMAYDLADPYLNEQLNVPPAPVYSQPVQGNTPNIAAPSVPSWYFCTASNAYYPYVTSCSSGWKAVSAVPPPISPGASNGAPTH